VLGIFSNETSAHQFGGGYYDSTIYSISIKTFDVKTQEYSWGWYVFPKSDFSSVPDLFKEFNNLPHSIDSIWGGVYRGPKSPIMLGIYVNSETYELSTNTINSFTKTYPYIFIEDSAVVNLIAFGISLDNVKDYRYRIVENDSTELIPWSPIPKLEQKNKAIRPYAVFGPFKALNKQWMVEVVNIKNYYIRDGVVFDWRINCKPAISKLIIRTNNDNFNIADKKKNHNYATSFDPSGVPLDLKFPADSVGELSLVFKEHPSIPYLICIEKEGKDIIESVWSWFLEDNLKIDSMHFSEPGKYAITVEYEGFIRSKNKKKLRIPFEVLPPPSKTFSAAQIVQYGTGIFFFLLFFFLSYYFYNKRKLRIANQLKEQTTLKLKSIRSQLNPHFMFNALGSIQGLMNKNEIEAANNYLSRFANLTRKVLDTSENELISLSDELKILEDYLYMEQLRFGFQYVISTEIDLNQANIEIPAMLIQPFVENAVKHGVSTLDGNGRIEVAISKLGNDLVLLVIDNGKGFSTEKINDNAGLGLKLCRERIALLNKTYTGQKISMDIVSDTKGTQVKVILCNWL
jgi:hypothetical protein